MGKSKLNNELIVFLAILTVAVFFRFYHLDSLPPGLWPDEAANGVDALKALDVRNFSIFYPANNGREGLFINIQALSVHFFDANAWSLRVVSAMFGTLTVVGLYFLTRLLFNWRVAAAASFFLAISFWHVNFSRIGFRAIMLPLILVWGFYFLWRGLKSGHLREFLFSGIIAGFGFYTYFSFRIAPLIVLTLFATHWNHLRAHYSHFKYEYVRNQLLRGFALLVLTSAILALPLLFYFYGHPGDFLKREGRPISVFAQDEPLKEFALSTIKTLAMFVGPGDYNQRHNIPGWPQLSLFIGIFFTAGFIREFRHLLNKKAGHFSTIHVFLFSWFFIMLMPGFLSTEAPHALRTIGAIPVVMIFAAQGFWWIMKLILRWHHLTDFHAFTDKRIYKKEAQLVLYGTLAVFMFSLICIEYWRYFKVWGGNPSVKGAFTQNYVDMAGFLNTAPGYPIYILVNEGDVLVDGVPNNAQTLKFLTKTHSQVCSNQKYIYYLHPDQLSQMKFPKKYAIIPLADNAKLRDELFWKLGLYPEQHGSFAIYKNVQ